MPSLTGVHTARLAGAEVVHADLPRRQGTRQCVAGRLGAGCRCGGARGAVWRQALRQRTAPGRRAGAWTRVRTALQGERKTTKAGQPLRALPQSAGKGLQAVDHLTALGTQAYSQESTTQVATRHASSLAQPRLVQGSRARGHVTQTNSGLGGRRAEVHLQRRAGCCGGDVSWDAGCNLAGPSCRCCSCFCCSSSPCQMQ